MPLFTISPAEESTTLILRFDQTLIESVTTDKLWSRLPGKMFTHRIERLWLLDGQVVDNKVVPIPPEVLSSELSLPEVAAAYAVIRASNYRMLQAVGEAPAEAQLVDAPTPPPEDPEA